MRKDLLYLLRKPYSIGSVSSRHYTPPLCSQHDFVFSIFCLFVFYSLAFFPLATISTKTIRKLGRMNFLYSFSSFIFASCYLPLLLFFSPSSSSFFPRREESVLQKRRRISTDEQQRQQVAPSFFFAFGGLWDLAFHILHFGILLHKKRAGVVFKR